MEETKHIILFMDDSGKLSKKEKFCVFAGITFLNAKDKVAFINKYKAIYNELKCKYCKQDNISCDSFCDEIKSSSISSSDRRRMMNLIKRYTTFAVVIRNELVYDTIMNDKASRGRYIDYSQKIVVKKIVNYLIKEKVIDPSKPLTLSLNIDEQTTKSNGYYSLKNSISEELAHGIVNFNYNKVHKPIINAPLTVHVRYLDSKQSYAIQAADIIAGTVRHKVLISQDYFKIHSELGKFLTVYKILP